MHFVIWSAGLLLGTATVLFLLRFAGPRGRGWAADLAALAYIGVIAAVAEVTGAGYILFPELGALSHDMFGRPGGRWARSPVLLLAGSLLGCDIQPCDSPATGSNAA